MSHKDPVREIYKILTSENNDNKEIQSAFIIYGKLNYLNEEREQLRIEFNKKMDSINKKELSLKKELHDKLQNNKRNIK